MTVGATALPFAKRATSFEPFRWTTEARMPRSSSISSRDSTRLEYQGKKAPLVSLSSKCTPCPNRLSLGDFHIDCIAFAAGYPIGHAANALYCQARARFARRLRSGTRRQRKRRTSGRTTEFRPARQRVGRSQRHLVQSTRPQHSNSGIAQRGLGSRCSDFRMGRTRSIRLPPIDSRSHPIYRIVAYDRRARTQSLCSILSPSHRKRPIRRNRLHESVDTLLDSALGGTTIHPLANRVARVSPFIQILNTYS